MYTTVIRRTALLLVAVTLLHPVDALDEWVEEWTAAAADSFTLETLAAYTDMATRHPRFFGRHVHGSPGRQTPSRRLNVDVSAGVERWRDTVAAYWPADLVDTALCIIDKESRGNPTADNPRSTARGLFQILRSWPIHFGYQYADLYNPAVNADLAYRIYLIQGWRAWTVHRRCGV